MKGIVVEIHNHMAAVLSDEGGVVKVSNYNYQIGQEVEISMKKQIKFKKAFAFASAAACILVMFGISAYAYYTPYTYVSLDVNPSIEYSVNRFNRVLAVKGVNDDGTEIISGIELNNLKNKSIEDAISLTIDEISDAGYLDSNTSGIVITTSSDAMTKAGELVQTLEKVVNKGVEKNNYEAVVTAEAVGADRVAEAQALGVTPGKLNLVEKMMESADSTENINKEEWLHKSVKDIMAKTNEYKELNQEKEQNAGKEPQNQEQNTNEEKNGVTNVNGEVNGLSEDSENGNSDTGNGSDVGNNSGTTNDSNVGNGSDSGSGSETTNDSNAGNGSDAGSGSGTTNDSNAGNGSDSSSGSEITNDSNADNGSDAGSGSGTTNDSNKKGN